MHNIIDIINNRWNEWNYNNKSDYAMDLIIKYIQEYYNQEEISEYKIPLSDDTEIFVNNLAYIELGIFCILCIDFAMYASEKGENEREKVTTTLIVNFSKIISEVISISLDECIDIINDRIDTWGKYIRENSGNDTWAVSVIDNIIDLIVQESRTRVISKSSNINIIRLENPMNKIQIQMLITNFYSNGMPKYLKM